MVPGKDIEDHFGGLEVGETYDVQVKVDDVIYNLWRMKYPKYVVSMMVTYIRLLVDDTFKDTVRRWKWNGEDVVKNFKYKLPFDWYFHYRYAVDNHNNLRHALP